MIQYCSVFTGKIQNLRVFSKEMETYMRNIVSVIGKDSVGIISKVSAVCSECDVNIVDITQSVLQDMFVMVMLTETEGSNCDFTSFSEKMKKIGNENNLDIRVMHEDIFNSMHRI